ncbi:hypothetical protein EON67_06460 [archaeon]|nr:MAG: hypothetical protein EON67_06460 [archaeon]
MDADCLCVTVCAYMTRTRARACAHMQVTEDGKILNPDAHGVRSQQFIAEEERKRRTKERTQLEKEERELRVRAHNAPARRLLHRTPPRGAPHCAPARARAAAGACAQATRSAAGGGPAHAGIPHAVAACVRACRGAAR